MKLQQPLFLNINIPTIPDIPSPQPSLANHDSAESDPHEDNFASADDTIDDPSLSNNSDMSANNKTIPSTPTSKANSKPNVSSPKTETFKTSEKSANFGRLTRQQARTQNISVTEPTHQPHTLEFLTRKKQKETKSAQSF